MFTITEISSSIGNIAMIYPLQFLLIGGLIALGLYELYQIFGTGRTFTQKDFIK